MINPVKNTELVVQVSLPVARRKVCRGRKAPPGGKLFVCREYHLIKGDSMESSGLAPHGTLLLILIVIYFLAASIETFDIRMIQARKQGILSPDDPMPPGWVAGFYWLVWIVWITIAILNWRLAITLFVIKFILKVLPVLETIGNILMRPFRPKMPARTQAQITYDTLIEDLNAMKHKTDLSLKEKRRIAHTLITHSGLSPDVQRDLIIQAREVFTAKIDA